MNEPLDIWNAAGAALLAAAGSAADWQARVRQAADLGYDIVHVADHLPTVLPTVAPFPSLVAAATVPGPRLGTLALNTGLYRPAVLARDERLRQHRGGRRRIQTGAIR